MKRLLLALSFFAGAMQARDIQVNFEIRNHERFPIFVRLLQKGYRSIDQFDNYKQTYEPALIGNLTLVNGKTGNAIDSWASGFDWSMPTYIEIAYFKNNKFINQIYAVPAFKTLYVAFENEQLRPQKGKGFGRFTQSGHPLVENVKAHQIVRLTEQQIKDLYESLELEGKQALDVLKQYVPKKDLDDNNDHDDDDLEKRFEQLKKDVKDIYQKYE
ncbi:MAG: hypothetical protein ACOYT8_05265 [Candidatus Dependentiae bacterium]